MSKQTVKSLVHNIEVEVPLKEKKKIQCLRIDADEDHVAAQFYEKKGDLEHDRSGRQINTLMRKLVCVYEDIEESGEKEKSKRYRLTGKYYFCRLYPGKENVRLWEEVRDYIY